MAFTVSNIANTVIGEKRLFVGRITPDAATGTVTVPGALAIDGLVSNSYVGGTSLTCANVAINVNPSGVAANGVVSYSNVASTQIYVLSVMYH